MQVGSKKVESGLTSFLGSAGAGVAQRHPLEPLNLGEELAQRGSWSSHAAFFHLFGALIVQGKRFLLGKGNFKVKTLCLKRSFLFKVT